MVRIIQESLTNAIKHSGADRVGVSIAERDGAITIKVSDNGAGFDVSSPAVKGHGLRNIRKRCEEMGARLAIDSGPGKGTEIFIEMSL